MPTLQRGLAAAIALSLLAARPAHAAEHVSYRDLDLSTPRDAEIMAGRIRRAAVAACEATHANIGQDFEAIERFEACRRQAIADAARRLASPQLSAALKLRHCLVVGACGGPRSGLQWRERAEPPPPQSAFGLGRIWDADSTCGGARTRLYSGACWRHLKRLSKAPR